MQSSSTTYFVLNLIGEGCYGKVARCQNLQTKEEVAVKILKPDSAEDIKEEVAMLELISKLNPAENNLVKFFEQFEYMGQTCLVFEMLDNDLYDLLEERQCNPVHLKEIRPIAQQLLVALHALSNIGVLHTDIKPDNVMFVNSQEQPLRIKLIDFGLAISRSRVNPGMDLQPTGYRAPEISLGLPFTEAIDVWGVGCILAFLYLADHLFSANCDYQMMKCIVEVLGQPEDRLLNAGMNTQHFFQKDEGAEGPTWQMRTEEQYKDFNNVQPQNREGSFDLPNSLDDLIDFYPDGGTAKSGDALAFVDLLKQLLHLDGDCRISAYDALQQPFITMAHLTAPGCKSYLKVSQHIMTICSESNSGDGLIPSIYKPSSWCQQNSDSCFYEGGISNPFGGDDSDGWMSEGETPPVYWDHHPTPCSSQQSSPKEVPPDGRTTPSDLSQTSDGEQASVLLEQHPVSWSSCGAQTEDNPTDGLATPLDLFQISETELPLVSLDENPVSSSSSSSFGTEAVDIPDDGTVTPSDFFQIIEEESPPVSLDVYQTPPLSPEAQAEDTPAEQQVTPPDLNQIPEIELPHVLDHIPVFCFSFGSEAEDIPTDDTAVHPDLLQVFEEELSPVTSDHNPAFCSTSAASAEDANPEGPATPSKFPKISEDESPPIVLDLQPDLCSSTERDEEVLIDLEEIHPFAAEDGSDLSIS
ncbi:homeodomain-interacting protein kinase 3-like isoform X2 [Nelusetta ayraudi]